MFIDSAKIFIRSGKGGDGCVSFRREKYVPAGGPDGGDGGRGGSLVFEVDEGRNTLNEFRYKRKFEAEDGGSGRNKRQHGADGADVVIKVPPGTIVRDAETGRVITDLSYGNKREVVLRGGNGGKGNQHYATPTMQVPKYAQPGQPAKELFVVLELKTIADVGLVGFPNVGKSTLLARVTNAKPKIANYHFTTLSPNLGVVDLDGGDGFVMADIPGLIEGASTGVGLGHEFLRHIERTRLLVHLVDAASTEGRDPIQDVRAINAEIAAYSAELAKRPQIIVANKCDLFYEGEGEEVLQSLKEAFEGDGVRVFPISAASGKGVKELLYYVKDRLKECESEPLVFEKEYDPQEELRFVNEPFSVSKTEDGVYVVEGPRIERMLGYTNLDSEKGFIFFQNFLKENQILDELEQLGIEEGDSVRMYGHQFDYYK